jgi:hypothetical protein
MMVPPSTEPSLQDIIDTNHYYDVGASIFVCKQALAAANELFGGDSLKGLLYIMADGYAISVGTNLPAEERRAARLRWNRNRAESESVRLREKYAPWILAAERDADV